MYKLETIKILFQQKNKIFFYPRAESSQKKGNSTESDKRPKSAVSLISFSNLLRFSNRTDPPTRLKYFILLLFKKRKREKGEKRERRERREKGERKKENEK